MDLDVDDDSELPARRVRDDLRLLDMSPLGLLQSDYLYVDRS